jgi:hypothetical protein
MLGYEQPPPQTPVRVPMISQVGPEAEILVTLLMAEPADLDQIGEHASTIKYVRDP